MHKLALLPASLLVYLFGLATAVPVLIPASGRKVDIWITKSNTLNATTWNHNSSNTVAVAFQISQPSESTVTNTTSIQSTESGTTITTTTITTTTISNTTLDANSTRPTTSNSTLGTAGQSNNGTRHANSTIAHSHGTANITSTSSYHPKANGTHHNLANSTRASGSRNILAISTVPQNTSSILQSNVSTTAIEVAAGTLPVNIINNYPSNNMKVYISGLDSNGALIMLGQSGGWEYPTTSSDTPVPVADTVALSLGASNTTQTFVLPSYIESGRIWIAEGGLEFFVVATPNGPGLVQPAAANMNDPSVDVNYAFAELSWGANYGIYADITNVDFVGLPLGIQLVNATGAVQSVLGTPADAAPRLCDQLTAQSQVDKRPWDKLCLYDTSGALVRVLAPSTFAASQATAFGTYYKKYVNDVWRYYSKNDLIIDTQAAPGNVTCRVQGGLLQCAGDNRGYAKPNNFDIFGCNTGPFAIQQGDNAVHYAVVPRLCAAFNRATLLLPGGNRTPSLPPVQYYQNDNRPLNSRPKNWYSELVHDMEAGGRGYAFAYDDVSPAYGEDQSGLVSSTSPTSLTIIVGGT